MSKEIVREDDRINLVDYCLPPKNHSTGDKVPSPSTSTNSKSNLEPDQLSSDLEEEDEKDPLGELLRICASSRFTIQRESDPSEEEEEEEGLLKDTSSKRIRKSKPRSRKKKNEFIIHSYSEYFTEEVEDTSSSSEDIEVDDDDESLDRLEVQLGSDPEFLKDWENYWAVHGENILWRTWNEKYKDYINPNYDLVDQLINVPICSESSDEEEEDINMPKEGSTSAKISEKTREMLKRRQEEKKKTEKNPDELWQETWNNHCQNEYTGERQNYAKKYSKLPKLDFITGDDAKNNPLTRKYYAQRYDLFSKYNQGIRLDCESWFSVTPEQIAIHNAKKCSVVGKDKVILDAFAGCGGNTIQFAKIFDKVIAIDIDPNKIENCRHNARIYGVENKIEFIVGDFMELAEKTGPEKLTADIVFLSPPWGGPNYQSKSVFNIKTMIPMNGFKLFDAAKTISNDIAYFLPRNVNENQLLKLAGVGNFVEIENNYHNDKVKTVTAYYGNLINRN